MKFLRFVLLGLIIFVILSPILYLYIQWAETAWFPVGVADPKLITVTGDKWAITSDHHFYFQNQRDKRKWWEGYPLESDEDSLIWGINEYGEAVISTSKGIHLRTHTIPAPSFYPTAVGGTYFCEKDHGYSNTVFAMTANQLAFYNYSDKKWEISVLSDFVTSPVVLPSRCQLFFLEGSELHYINLIFDDFNNNEKSDISEHSYDFAEYGGITAIATSGGNIWALTGSGDVLKIETDFSAEKFITWNILPSPPRITNPVLISGISGPDFGSLATHNIDLWLKSDAETYWYNEELGEWEIFPFPYEKLTSISSVTTGSEPFGNTITRLAIANGKVYRQYPVLSKLQTTFPIFILPMIFLFSFLLSGIIMIKRSLSG